MQHPSKMEHYKSDIEDQEYQIKIYQRFNLKPNRENVGLVSKSRIPLLQKHAKLLTGNPPGNAGVSPAV